MLVSLEFVTLKKGFKGITKTLDKFTFYLFENIHKIFF